MKKYENPEVELISLDNTDVILTSFVNGGSVAEENTGSDSGFAKSISILNE